MFNDTVASVTVLPGGEIFQALEKGAIDASEFSMPSIDQRLGFDRVVKINHFPGWHQTDTAFHLVMNQELWERHSLHNRRPVDRQDWPQQDYQKMQLLTDDHHMPEPLSGTAYEPIPECPRLTVMHGEKVDEQKQSATRAVALRDDEDAGERVSGMAY